MAESELGVLASQCLDRRIDHQATLAREVCARTKRRNTHNAKADWRFTTGGCQDQAEEAPPLASGRPQWQVNRAPWA
jgi:hypothetical protein